MYINFVINKPMYNTKETDHIIYIDHLDKNSSQKHIDDINTVTKLVNKSKHSHQIFFSKNQDDLLKKFPNPTIWRYFDDFAKEL